MVSIKPALTLFKNISVIQKGFANAPIAPQRIKAESLKALRYATDELCLSTQKRVISLDEVKALFPTGKLEDNYIVRDIKNLLSELQTERKIIDLTPELSEKDYKIIQNFMNRDNGRFIEQWKGFSDTDIVPNIQKLALFTRTMRLTKQTNEFLEFNPNQWEMAFEGIVRKPRDMIMPILEYKANSNPINIPLQEKKITHKLKETIDKITEFINMFSVKKDFVAYRGDGSFNILSGVKIGSEDISLADIMKQATEIFKEKFKNNQFNKNEVDKFTKEILIGQDIEQSRFMSIGMTQSAADKYAKKIKWKIKIPQGTKGVSIESYNVERLNEAEFLGQRNGILKIRKANYCPKKDLWYFDATLEQKPIDEIVVNC